MNKLGNCLLAVLLTIACFSCNKMTCLEETIVFPKTVEAIEGQKIVMYGRLIQQSITSSVDQPVQVEIGTQYAISSWQVSDSEVLEIIGDTLMALSEGQSEVVGLYKDKWIDHEVKCDISVQSSNLPLSNDTIFACVDDTVMVFDFWAHPGHAINYNVKYENLTNEHGVIIRNGSLWEIRGGCMVISRFVEYNLQEVIREGMKVIHVSCDTLGIDVRIPVVVLSE